MLNRIPSYSQDVQVPWWAQEGAGRWKRDYREFVIIAKNELIVKPSEREFLNVHCTLGNCPTTKEFFNLFSEFQAQSLSYMAALFP